ncbi:MAG: HAD family hydrolase, partial [Mesorhizobium sp.]
MNDLVLSQTNVAPTPDVIPILGLTNAEARARFEQYGPNTLPQPHTPSLAAVFLRQFLSPLIYILLFAAVVSLALGDAKDALFIGAVLVINGIIGAAQEYSAGRAAAALRSLEEPHASVVRDGTQCSIDARELVPGDLVLLEAGSRVPADIQLLLSEDLQCDESLLTGESRPVKKSASSSGDETERTVSYAGSMITRGRGRGVVVSTGGATEIGKIAEEIGRRSISK